ncbi:MAG: hypothetical protein Q4B14_03615 [Clostridia bacterium]|nr:hypothetical protein [Clostridia bacterium]
MLKIKHKKTVIAIITVFIYITMLISIISIDKNVRKTAFDDDKALTYIYKNESDLYIASVNILDFNFNIDISHIVYVIERCSLFINSVQEKTLDSSIFC